MKIISSQYEPIGMKTKPTHSALSLTLLFRRTHSSVLEKDIRQTRSLHESQF